MKNSIENILDIHGVSLNSLIDEYEKGHDVWPDVFLYYVRLAHGVNEAQIDKVKAHIERNTVKTSLSEYPLLSVIIPTYNRKRMLKNCLDSVLAQSYHNIEIIVIDDCSTDGTSDFINQSYYAEKIKYIRNDVNKNAGHSRQIGYNASNGEFVVFLDDDDFYLDNDYYMKAIAKHLEYNNLAFVCANTFIENSSSPKIILDRLNVKGLMESEEYLLHFQKKYSKPNSTFTAVFRRDILDKADLKNMKMMNDTSIYLRALSYGMYVYFFEDIVGVYRIHDSNISRHLSVQFIIENLEEKVWVYRSVKERYNKNELDKWILDQLMITIGYFINKSKSSMKSVCILLWWSVKRSNELKINLFFRIIKMYIRSKLPKR